MREDDTGPVERPRVTVVAGMARDRTIGKDGGIPWTYPEDMRSFREATMGTALVMGRKTLESIGRLLPGRETIVVTRHPDAVVGRWPGAHAVTSVAEALDRSVDLGLANVSICGGGEIYALSIPLADEMLLTYVPEDGGGDTFFPEWDEAEWVEAGRDTIERVERVRYVRKA
jgi:dihydrofolate reductase